MLFLISLLVLGVAVYFYFHLAKRLDFLVFSAAALPTAVYAFCASIYLLYAKKKQATIDGQVNINHAPAPFVSVKLFGDHQLMPIAETEKREGGRYRFHVWVRPSIRTYKIVATYASVNRESGEFSLSQGKPIPGPVLDIDVNVQPKEPAQR